MSQYITTPADYWIASNAITITLNVQGGEKPYNRIQGGVTSGAVIMCLVKEVTEGDGLGYGADHNPKRWPLSLSPTYFNSDTEKYVYVAIPRSTSIGTQAVVVFPSEKLDIYGRSLTTPADSSSSSSSSSSGDDDFVGAQIGSPDYFYVYLQAVIDVPTGDPLARHWKNNKLPAYGELDTAEGIENKINSGEWYDYNSSLQRVTFLKQIIMGAQSWFSSLRLGSTSNELTGVAKSTTSSDYVDSDVLVTTPGYVKNNYLSKKTSDTAQGIITFVSGLVSNALAWFKSGIKIGASSDSTIGIDGVGDSNLRSLILSITNAIAEKSSGFVDNEISGGLTGHGFGLKIGSDGRAKIQTDDLLVLGRMLVNTLEIREVSYIGGVYLLTSAGSKVAGFEALYSSDSGNTYDSRQWKTLRELHTSEVPSGYSVRGWRLYLLSDDGTTATMNYWKPGDMAYCQTFDIKPGVHTNVSNSYWRRLVTKRGSYTAEDNILGDGKGYDYIDVSDTAVVKIPAGTTTDWSYGMTVEDGVLWVRGSGGGTALAGYIGYNGGTNPNTTPRVDDKAVCLGSQVYSDRQAAVQISAEGVGSIDIFDGINGYDSLDSYTIHSFNKNKVRMSARRFEWTTADGNAKPPTIYRGTWYTDAVSQWGDEWTYQGLQWLCVLSSGTTTEAPGTHAAYWMCLTPNVVRRWLQVTPTALELDSDGNTKSAFSLYIEGWKQTGNNAPVKLTLDDYDGDERILVFGYIEDYLANNPRLESGNDYFDWDTTNLRWKISRNNGVIPIGYFVSNVSVVWYTDSSETAYHDKVDIVTTRDGADGADGQDGEDGQDGQDGADGKDAWTLQINPNPIIIEQNINDGSFPFSANSPLYIDMTAKCGDQTATVGQPIIVFNGSMGLSVSAMKSGNHRLKITAYNKVSGVYVTNGYISCNVPLTYGSRSITLAVRIEVGVNLLGEWETKIQGDTEKSIARKITYAATGTELDTIETVGKYIRSSTENIAFLTRDVNGKLDNSTFRQTVDGFTMELTSPLSVKGRNYLLQSASFTYKTRRIDISSQLYEDIRTLNPSAEHPVYLGLSCKYFATTASDEFNRSGFTTGNNRLGFYIYWNNSIQLETFAYYSNPPSDSSKITKGSIETIKKVIEITSIPGTLGDCSFYNQIYGGSYVADRVMIGFAKLEILEANDVNLITGWSIAPEDNYIDGNNLLDTATNIIVDSSSYVNAWKNRKTTDVAISRGKTLRFTIPNFRDAVKNKSVLFYIDFKDTTGYNSYTFQLKAGGAPYEMSGVSALIAQSPYGYGYTRYFFRKFLDEHESGKYYTSGNTSINANTVDLYISSSYNPPTLYIKDAGVIALDEYNNITPSLQRTGIDIQRGKITAQTDNFEIVNSQGQQTFSIDQYGNLVGAGNAKFAGVIDAKILYRRIVKLNIYQYEGQINQITAAQLLSECNNVLPSILTVYYTSRSNVDKRFTVNLPAASGWEGHQMDVYVMKPYTYTDGGVNPYTPMIQLKSQSDNVQTSGDYGFCTVAGHSYVSIISEYRQSQAMAEYRSMWHVSLVGSNGQWLILSSEDCTASEQNL